MDKGGIYSSPNTSAANAIQNALEKHLGQKVSTCHCDGMSFDIPKHDALPLDWKPKPINRKLTDQSAPMFDDDSIKAESINAKEKSQRTKVFGG